MSLALLRKEVREHGWVLAAVVAFAALSLLGQLVNASDQGGRFSALVRFTGAIATLASLVTANRLFAREYAGKTQLFLEVLPISRARVMATKWLAGAAFQCGLVGTAWLVTLQYMRRTEVITLDDGLRALLAVEAFTLAIWSFSAMAGLLGRYRYVAWLGLGLFYSYLSEAASLAAAESPLLRLLSEASAMARTPVPSRALVEAGVVILGSVLITAVLGLTGSGAMAAALARRMTSRERVFVIAAALVAIVVGDRLKKERELPPFELASATRSTSSRGVVGVMTTQDVDEATARALGQTVSGDVDSLSEALGLQKRLPVFILPQRGLDRTLTQRAELSGANGIVVRAAPDVEPAVLRSRVLHELLTDETDFRARKEDRHALLDGLALWWTLQDDPALRERWWARAAVSSVPLSPSSVLRWDETSERLGECLTNAVAFCLVDTLVATVGRERTLVLAGQLFSTPPQGVRAMLFEQSPTALLRAAGTDWEALTTEAERRRLAFREAHRDELAERPKTTAQLQLRDTGEGEVVAVEVTGVERWRVLFGRLGPWSRGQANLQRLDVRGSQARLPLTLARGDLLLAAVEYEDAVLGCPVRLEAQRLESR